MACISLSPAGEHSWD